MMTGDLVQIKKRNPIYDCAKGLGILFVVMGHCCAIGSSFYTKFHVLFFFIFAGLMLKSDNIINFKELWNNIKKFWKRYALPFIICNSIFLLLFNLFVKYHLVTFDDRYPSGISYLSLNAIAMKLLKIFLIISSSEQLCGAIWFLKSLFWGLTTVAFILYITNKLNIHKYIMYGCFLIFFIIFLVATKSNSLFFYIQSVLCIIIGDILKQFIQDRDIDIKWLLISLISILFLVPYIKIKIIATMLYGIFGFEFIYQMSMLIHKYSNIIFSLFAYLGKYTLPILCLHFLSFKIITYFYILVTKSDILLLGSFPILTNQHYQSILCVLYILSGIIIPILLYVMYSKLQVRILQRCK